MDPSADEESSAPSPATHLDRAGAPAVHGLLAPMGVGERAESLYALLGEQGQLPLSALGAQEQEVAELGRAGLVRQQQDRLVAVPVRVAVEQWAVEQESQIYRARSAAAQYAATQRASSGGFIEVIRGLDLVREAASHVQLAAEREVCSFDLGPCFSDALGVVSEVQGPQSERGVRYRTLYRQDALQTPELMSTVRDSLQLGEDARVFPDVPVRMIIADQERAILVLPYGQAADGYPTDMDAVVVYPSAFLDALVQLFEAIWAMALPIGELRTEDPSEEHRQLLTMLVAGLTDASIARELAVSERTVHRRISRLQQLLGANTRFLLGVQAVKHGWI